MAAELPPASPPAVVAIKNRRNKKGDTQYLVVYQGERTDRGHWISINQLSCADLIETYEAETTRAREQAGPSAAPKITEVLGLSHHNGELYYVVRYGEDPEPQFITRAYASRHCARQVLAFYESHLIFESECEHSPPDAPRTAPASGPVSDSGEDETPPSNE